MRTVDTGWCVHIRTDDPEPPSDDRCMKSPFRTSRTARASRVARRKQAAAPVARKDSHVTHAQSPVRIGIDAQMPNSMPRWEDDAITRGGSNEFHDRPGSGKHIHNRQFVF